MNIAQIAPPWLALPPKTYGGTESVLSTLVEEQVAQGHEVTLFASGDAKTKARLASFFPTSLLLMVHHCARSNLLGTLAERLAGFPLSEAT